MTYAEELKRSYDEVARRLGKSVKGEPLVPVSIEVHPFDVVREAEQETEDQKTRFVADGSRIVDEVCAKYRVTRADVLYSGRRVRPLPQARWEIAHILSQKYGWTTGRIGRLLDLDKTSVVYGVCVHAYIHDLPKPTNLGKSLNVDGLKSAYYLRERVRWEKRNDRARSNLAAN